jgi:hypothetical protein
MAKIVSGRSVGDRLNQRTEKLCFTIKPSATVPVHAMKVCVWGY